MIGELTLAPVPLVATEIGDEIVRGHDRLGKQHGGRRRHGQDCAERLGDEMSLRLILAVRSETFPGECDRIESKDLDAVHGRARISFFGDTNFTVNRPPVPITLIVEGGRVTGAENSTPEFDRVLAHISEDEGEVRLRELGFGMNRAFTQERRVTDVGAYERMCGVHLTLGSKHAVYNKLDINKKTARQHVDVFVLTDAVRLDDEVVYRDGAWDVHAHE